MEDNTLVSFYSFYNTVPTTVTSSSPLMERGPKKEPEQDQARPLELWNSFDCFAALPESSDVEFMPRRKPPSSSHNKLPPAKQLWAVIESSLFASDEDMRDGPKEEDEEMEEESERKR
ncbi:hypothetical protein QOT17_007606 [Balamuthia mandrillaris]